MNRKVAHQHVGRAGGTSSVGKPKDDGFIMEPVELSEPVRKSLTLQVDRIGAPLPATKPHEED